MWKKVDFDFFQQNKPNATSDAIVWIGITALICAQNPEGYLMLTDGQVKQQLRIESDVYETSSGRRQISRLGVGEAYNFINICYVESTGELLMTQHSHIESVDAQFPGEIEVNITDINSTDLNHRIHGEYIFERLVACVCEIKKTEHREGKDRVTTFRKIRMQDNHRSDIFLTLWGSAVQIPEQLNMVKGTFIALRNFKANEFNGSVGINYIEGRTRIKKLAIDEVDTTLKSNLNRDWDKVMNNVAFGKVAAIEDVHTQKKCMATGNVPFCSKAWPITQTVCESIQCKSNARGQRRLVEDYSLKLIFFDETNRKMEITAFKKNIDTFGNTSIPRVSGTTLKHFIYERFQYMLRQEKVKITYWLKTTADGEKEPIFSGYKTIIDESGQKCNEGETDQ